MDNSMDRLLELTQQKKTRLIYRFSPGLYMFPDSGDEQSASKMSPVANYCYKALTGLAGTAPAVMFDRAAFAFYGIEGLMTLSMCLVMAKNLGYFTILDGCFAGGGALKMCEASFYAESSSGALGFPADAVTVSPYCAAEDIRAMARICREEDKAIFICAKDGKSDDKDSFENVKTDGGLTLFETAVDDAGAFGESYVGEKGYSVIGFATAPAGKNQSLRDLDRWGIALVRATPDDLDDANTYSFFYPKECEGEFIALSDKDIAEKLGCADKNFDFEAVAGYFKAAAEEVEKKRLEKK